MYKIISKVLAERIRKVIPCIISSTQSAFVGARQILDLVLVANEVVEYYRAKKKKSWILKLDMEKAVDQVDWSFLERILTLMRFHSKWVEWINGCI